MRVFLRKPDPRGRRPIRLHGAPSATDDRNNDRLSHLPDTLLRNIVSGLPVKDAARTAVLSRRWRPLGRAALRGGSEFVFVVSGAVSVDARKHFADVAHGYRAHRNRTVFNNFDQAEPDLLSCVHLVPVKCALHAAPLGGYDDSLDDGPESGFSHLDAPPDQAIGHVGQARAADAVLGADAVGAAGGGQLQLAALGNHMTFVIPSTTATTSRAPSFILLDFSRINVSGAVPADTLGHLTCLHELQVAVHRQPPRCVQARRHSAMSILLPPRDAATASPNLTPPRDAFWMPPAADLIKYGILSISAAQMFEEMWNSNSPTAAALRASRLASIDLAVHQESNIQLQHSWPSLAVLPLRPTLSPSFGCCPMLQLPDTSHTHVSSSARLAAWFGTVIVRLLQNNSSVQFPVSCQMEVYVAVSMDEMFWQWHLSFRHPLFALGVTSLNSAEWQMLVRGRCWSLHTTQGWIDRNSLWLGLEVCQLMCIEQSYGFSSSCSILLVASFLVVQLQWQPEDQPRPLTWPHFHREQDVQRFSLEPTFAMGAQALDSFGRTCYKLCNTSSSSLWNPGGILFLLHHHLVRRVKMLIMSCLGSMCNMMIQSMQLHDDVFCRILWLDSYSRGLNYSCDPDANIISCWGLFVEMRPSISSLVLHALVAVRGAILFTVERNGLPDFLIRCVPATALPELLLVISVSIVACGMILGLAQRKGGGNCWRFLLEGSQLKDIAATQMDVYAERLGGKPHFKKGGMSGATIRWASDMDQRTPAQTTSHSNNYIPERRKH